MADNEKIWIIDKFKRYKSSLEIKEADLLEELSKYQHSVNDDNLYEFKGEFKDLEYDIYNNPYETYLIAQIKMVKALPSLLDDHINCIEQGKDLDMVLDSLEFEIYKIKKDVYSNIKEWENLINHLSDARLVEIENNPKGPGDLIVKELCWIRNYEEKWG
jgi:MerR family transcriptional regulator, copper efflux regulator